MDIRDLVQSILEGDLLAAREWVADARRSHVTWSEIQRPEGLDERELSVAAAVVELLAARSDEPAPAWTTNVGALREQIVLDPGLQDMPRSFARAKLEGPEPLRKRNLVALPDFLDVA